MHDVQIPMTRLSIPNNFRESYKNYTDKKTETKQNKKHWKAEVLSLNYKGNSWKRIQDETPTPY